MHAIIIGSGMAGLTAGAALARAGHAVTVLEQNPEVGGVTAGYAARGYQWELGQLILEGFAPGEPCGQVLAGLGVKITVLEPGNSHLPRSAPQDGIIIRKDDRGYVFPDFEIRKPAEFGGVRWRMQRLAELFPAERAGLERYWRDYVRFTALLTAARRMEGAGLAGKARLYWRLLPLISRAKWSAARLMDSYFQSEQLKGVFITILADFFTPPSQFQGLGVFAINPEPVYDCRQPQSLGGGAEHIYHYSLLGGMPTLVRALEGQIQSHGGQVLTGQAATRVIVEAGRARGVETAAGEVFPADVVLASGGAQELFLSLVGEQHLPPGFAEKIRSLPLMDSVFMLHLGLDYDPSPWLHGVCTYFYGTYEVEGEIRRAKAGEYHEGAAGFVVHAPWVDARPSDGYPLTIYTIAPDRLKDGDWASRKQEYADKLLAHAGQRIPGLQQHVRDCETLTPDDFRQRTHTAHHAFGGLAPVMDAWRPPHQTPVAGLWFIGAQSESGGGVNNVIPAAFRVAQRILR